MNNRWIYFITLFVSLILVILPLFCEAGICSILSSIGCSALAAAVMALFLERANAVREEKKKQLSRNIYLRQFNSQITMLIERVIWFDERMDDQAFNWNNEEGTYSTLQFMVWADSRYEERSISFEEAVAILEELERKYSKERMANCSPQEKERIQKLFSIVAVSSKAFVSTAIGIKDDKLILAVSDYLSIGDNESIQFDVQYIIGTMLKKLDAYNNALSSLIRLAKKIREIGQYSNEIRIGLHGSISIFDI